MITIYGASKNKVEDYVEDGTVIFPPAYVLLCKDSAGNQLEIKTDEDTYVEVSNFLHKLKQV
jgi:hypothetical protein